MPEEFYIVSEDDDNLITEDSDSIVTEDFTYGSSGGSTMTKANNLTGEVVISGSPITTVERGGITNRIRKGKLY